jgi:predicted metalloprotease with PDZ domain
MYSSMNLYSSTSKQRSLFIAVLLLVIVFFSTPIQAKNSFSKPKSKFGVKSIAKDVALYAVEVDLINVKDDRIKIIVTAPSGLNPTENRYIIPRSVPGTYSKDDYGRFVEDAKAFTSDGKEITVKRDDNDFIIEGIPARLEYYVRDTWDDKDGVDVFQPTGSNIEQDSNYVLNTHCIIGYFEKHKLVPYTISVKKPEKMYGATSLPRISSTPNLDIFSAKTYPFLVDNPIMYCQPDTTSFKESGTNIMVSVYSPNKRITSNDVAKILRPVAHSLGKFFGTMPVDRYTFLFYFAGSNQPTLTRSGAFGALEHSYSSLYFLPEGSGKSVEQATELIRQTSAHEFLHILVPLNLHSKEIHDFDYREPKMSQHLWLYEGCTEYFSMLALAQDTTTSEKEFFAEMNGKISASSNPKMNTFSLVTLSKRVLEPEYQKIYPIIYEKGAVTAFLLDLEIRKLTNWKLDLLGMIRQLTDKYGPDKPFDDDVLYEEMYKVVHPDLKNFVDKYIVGYERLPYNSLMESIGYSVQDSIPKKIYQFNQVNLSIDRNITDKVVLRSRRENDFGIMDGDTLISINGNTITTIESGFESLISYIWRPSSSSTVTIVVRRNGNEVTMKAEPKEKTITLKNQIAEVTTPTPMQLENKKRFFKK